MTQLDLDEGVKGKIQFNLEVVFTFWTTKTNDTGDIRAF